MRFFWLLLVALGLGTKRHWHILFAILLGIGLGLLFSEPEYYMLQNIFEIVGQIFIRLITMIVVPLVISSLIVGVSSLGDGRQLGRMGGKVLVLFLLLMTVASIIGAGLSLAFEPGTQLRSEICHEQTSGFQTRNRLQAEICRPHGEAAAAPGLSSNLRDPVLARSRPEFEQIENPPSLEELFVNMIPRNPVEAIANMQLVPMILFTILFGIAIASIGDAGKPLISFFEAVFTATMKLTDWIMILAVPGVFSLAFVSVAMAGPRIFLDLAPYALIILGGLLIQVVVIFPLMLWLFARINWLNLYRAISEAIMVAFGTASSSATLPITIAACERRAGISNRIASFVLPTGATVNKTATTMFEAIAVIFLAQAYGIPLEPHTVVLVIIFAIVASIGAPGVPSAGLITMAIVVQSLGKGFEQLLGGIAVLWFIDRALDMCRTAVNVMSSCTVAALVASSEGELNRDILNNREVWREVV